MKRFLTFFSYAFHPLFTPSYASALYFALTRHFFYIAEIYLVFVQVFIVTVLLPVSIFFFLRSLGLMKSSVAIENKERRLPLAFYALLLFVLIKHSFSVTVITELYYFFVGILISALAGLLLILFRQKGSLHVMGVSAFTTYCFSLAAYYEVNLLPVIAFMVFATGAVASSRIYSGQHSLSEVTLGALLGILPQVVLWPVWLLPAL